MKTYRFITMASGLFISSFCIAQQQNTLGRFLVGTNPFSYFMSKTSSQTQSYDGGNGIETDSAKLTSHTISTHVNLFIGYFVTKNICTGLQFGNNTFLSPFFRYYPFRKNPDSSKIDFFLQANFTFYNDNTTHAAVDNIDTAVNNFYATSSYSVNTYDFEFHIGAAAAWNFNRHWALEGEIGYEYVNSVTKTSSYTNSNGEYIVVGGNRFINSYIIPATKNVSLSNEAFLRLMLSYRL